MATNYANEKIATAIRNHLLDVDAVPPTAEASRLAGELAQICLTELKTAGLRSETVERLFAPRTLTAKARGVH
jgi:hypothetical protein